MQIHYMSSFDLFIGVLAQKFSHPLICLDIFRQGFFTYANEAVLDDVEVFRKVVLVAVSCLWHEHGPIHRGLGFPQFVQQHVA